MNSPVNVRLGDLFTEAELQRAADVIAEAIGTHTINRALVREVVTPAKMQHIDAVTGQPNDARYIAYVLEFTLREATK